MTRIGAPPDAAPAQPVAELYRVIDAEIRLLAGACRDTGRLVFPFPHGPEAAAHDLVLLPAAGPLWSWTMQRFAPKSPYDGPVGEAFQPYAVAYVQLGDKLIVEGRVTLGAHLPLQIGQPMRVVREVYAHTPDGQSVETYAFAPAERPS